MCKIFNTKTETKDTNTNTTTHSYIQIQIQQRDSRHESFNHNLGHSNPGVELIAHPFVCHAHHVLIRLGHVHVFNMVSQHSVHAAHTLVRAGHGADGHRICSIITLIVTLALGVVEVSPPHRLIQSALLHQQPARVQVLNERGIESVLALNLSGVDNFKALENHYKYTNIKG